MVIQWEERELTNQLTFVDMSDKCDKEEVENRKVRIKDKIVIPDLGH